MTQDPLVVAFQKQKSGAAKRGITWELEYWEWLQIWQESGHLHERGVHAGEYVMSRPGDKGPYSASNVRIVLSDSNRDESNSRRQTRRGEPSKRWVPASNK